MKNLKINIYEYMKVASKIMYIKKLPELVQNYNNNIYKTIKIKPLHAKPETYADCTTDNNAKNTIIKVDEYLWISDDENLFSHV